MIWRTKSTIAMLSHRSVEESPIVKQECIRNFPNLEARLVVSIAIGSSLRLARHDEGPRPRPQTASVAWAWGKYAGLWNPGATEGAIASISARASTIGRRAAEVSLPPLIAHTAARGFTTRTITARGFPYRCLRSQRHHRIFIGRIHDQMESANTFDRHDLSIGQPVDAWRSDLHQSPPSAPPSIRGPPASVGLRMEASVHGIVMLGLQAAHGSCH
jgi:hypothetical protein